MDAHQKAKRKDLEENLIGTLLRNPQALASAALKPEWFIFHKKIIDAMMNVVGRGKEIDVFTVAESYGDQKLSVFLHNCQQGQFLSVANLSHAVASLQDMWKCDNMKLTLQSSLAEIEGGANADDAIKNIMQKTLYIAVSDSKSSNHTLRQGLGIFIDQIAEKWENKGKIGLQTGIINLDKVLGGLHSSDMTIVGARPGVGKTSFGVTVMMNLAKNGARCGFISTEMPVDQIMLRITSAETGIPSHNLRDVNLQESDFSLITAAINKIHKLNVRICDKPNMTIADVALQCQAWAIDGIDFVLVDYLTRIKPVKTYGNQVQDVGDVVTGLKTIARQLNIPLMVLAQLNRKPADRAGKMPMMSDLRDSGVIEQEADQVLLLHRPEDDMAEPSRIIVDKNRHGESNIEIRTLYKKETMQWLNLAEHYGDDG